MAKKHFLKIIIICLKIRELALMMTSYFILFNFLLDNYFAD